MENSPCSAKPNSQSEKEEEKSNESNYFLKDSDVHCQQRTSLMKNTTMEGPSVNIGADLPQAKALISVVRKEKAGKKARSSAPIINNLEPDFSDNTESFQWNPNLM
ncbi:uncharacterized protein Pyn_25447 [Prunus yedoensis var. nudiflora]|uniref:Uncharacterized protein n=1 Tax=Prunus yedoensis var. nudiflora TaxID=2094558 RepID=A0A314UH87_PRUYE|nr:uncharacterized protein Pyn_25447 [Prunus yedoensis var. nudiflora]